MDDWIKKAAVSLKEGLLLEVLGLYVRALASQMKMLRLETSARRLATKDQRMEDVRG